MSVNSVSLQYLKFIAAGSMHQRVMYKTVVLKQVMPYLLKLQRKQMGRQAHFPVCHCTLEIWWPSLQACSPTSKFIDIDTQYAPEHFDTVL